MRSARGLGCGVVFLGRVRDKGVELGINLRARLIVGDAKQGLIALRGKII